MAYHYHNGKTYTLQFVGTTRSGRYKYLCPVCKRVLTV